MRVLAFSDTHLGKHFNQRKFDFLRNLISQAENVIINGDFWDKSSVDFDTFIQSKWSGLFPILKERNTIYLYGNHDPKSEMDERVNFFSDIQAEEYVLKLETTKVYFEHGNRLIPGLNERIHNKLVERFCMFIDYVSHEIENRKRIRIWKKIRKAFLGIMPHKLIIMAKGAKKHRNGILVVGHTHTPAMKVKRRHINLGYIRIGEASYLTIDDEDNIQLHKTTY